MGTKTFKSHMIQKHDIASNWALSNFIPMKGELVVYDIDDTYSYERFKIGDGVTTAHNLPFVTDSIADSIDACKDLIGDTSVSAQISDAINGITLSNFGVAATSTELNKLNGMTATTTELNYVDGVTSNIQTQLNGKAASDHTHSSYVNQNAFSNVKVGATTVAADTATDTLTLVGSNVTLTPDATNDKVTIGITKDNVVAALGYTPPTTNTTYSAAGSSLGLVKSGGDVTISSGVITVNDDSHNHTVSNIDGLQATLDLIGDVSVSEQISEAFDGAITGLSISGKTITYTKGDGTSGTLTTQDTNTVYTHPTTSGNKHIPSGGSSGQILRWSADGTAAWGEDNNTTYSTFVKSGSGAKAGLVPAPSTTAGTTKYLREDGTWTAPPNTTYSAATQSAQGLMSAADKTKLDGIATGANKTTVDSALSSTSTNPVQNKVVNTAISNLNTLVGDTSVSTQITNAMKNAITGMSVSGKTITYTKGDGTSGTITTQDTNTTYSNMTGATSSAAGQAGLVPAPAAGKQTSFLRGDGTWVVPTNTTYSAATTSAAGLMSAADKTKLDGIATGANKITVDSALSSTSTNPVQNKAVQAAISNLSALVGDEAVAEQISTAIANKSDSGHTHDGRYYTESEIDTKLSGKANSSHGNHVPTVETANNAKFLRNDNTWQTVTPANIGAAAASHGTHVSYSTIAPVMDGTASVGSASTVARSDHKHPTDTSRASASSVTALQSLVGDTAVSTQIASATSSLVKTVNGITPDTNGNVSVQAGVTSVNGKTGAVTINRESLLMIASATEPTSPTTGMIWFDIS